MFACEKEQVFNQEQEKRVVNIEIKGAVLSQDTLEFVLNDKVFGLGQSGFSINKLLSANDKVQIRTKINGNVIGEIDVAESPFNQERRILYDGTTLTDNIVITPVNNPQNMGVRLSFSTSFADFYGGPVDVEIFHQIVDWNTFEFNYIPVEKITGVTRSFGNFLELPPLPESNDMEFHQYVFKVYKTGTQELPYTKMDKVQLSDPENNIGQLSFAAGTSQLIIISPNMGDGIVGDGYAAGDIAGSFK